MALSEARRRANEKYNAKSYEQIQLRVKTGEKDIIKDHAALYDDGSVNAFINRAIRETMERDKDK